MISYTDSSTQKRYLTKITVSIEVAKISFPVVMFNDIISLIFSIIYSHMNTIQIVIFCWGSILKKKVSVILRIRLFLVTYSVPKSWGILVEETKFVFGLVPNCDFSRFGKILTVLHSL